MTHIKRMRFRNKHLLSAATTALAIAMAPLQASAVVPGDGQTSEEIVDNAGGVNGVGMFFRNDGFVCSGTLINPRTVLFAAHCVNNRPESDYGPVIQSAWAFEVNALPGFQNWIANGFTSNPSLSVFNINQILYNPASLARPDGFGFLEGDIAISSLDTPASNIPTWALLFSPLTTPTSIDPVTGTGYHVNITGYGRTGNAQAGAITGIDFRRRAAENYLGALTSLDERNVFLFGAAFGDLPQNLYHLDFDDATRTDPFDFNLFRDDALPREGTTAGGDSGGPLIIDAANNAGFNEDLVIGVLSGGSRFFGPQPFSSYGTSSFYQPLYLHWDWIAANNPYRYVGANAGDGNWEDASHWVTEVDPNYRIIDATGTVVNDIPSNPGAGITGSDPDFGEVCFIVGGPGDGCQDLETGNAVPASGAGNPAITSGDNGLTLENGLVDNGLIRVSLDESGGNSVAFQAATPTQVGIVANGNSRGTGQVGQPSPLDVVNAPQAGGFSDLPLPAATIDNGLPGATGFVPSNVDPDIIAGINARYFDVTLSATGTTTLNSTVEIDRLTIAGSGAGLDITSAASLTSLIEVMHLSGSVNVDGALTTPGDYLLMSGILSGTGNIQTPFLTNISGVIAPGTNGSIGTLSVNGSVILASGSALAIDLGASGSSDLFAVTGDVSFGGALGLSFVQSNTPTFGDMYTVMTYGGTASGQFDSVLGLSGVLFGRTTIAGGTVTLDIDAASFLTVLPTTATPTQLLFGQVLDSARQTNYAGMSELFTSVDLLGSVALASAFDAMSPYDTIIAGQGLLAQGDLLSRRFDRRADDVRNGSNGLVVSANAQPLQVASADPFSGYSALVGQLAAADTGSGVVHQPMKEGWGMFVDVNYFTGTAETGIAGQDADIDGTSISVGIDRTFDNGLLLGIMASYSDGDNDFDTGLSGAEVSGTAIGAYGSFAVGQVNVDGHVSIGWQDIDTSRTAPFAAPLSAVGSTDADQLLAGITVSRPINMAGGMRITPAASLHHASYDIDGYTETGSSIALDIASRDLSTTQLSLGAIADWEFGDKGQFQPSVGGTVVYDIDADRDIVTGTFVGAPTSPPISVFGPDRTKVWFEAELGLDMRLSKNSYGGINVRQTVGRDDLTYTVLGASLNIAF